MPVPATQTGLKAMQFPRAWISPESLGPVLQHPGRPCGSPVRSAPTPGPCPTSQKAQCWLKGPGQGSLQMDRHIKGAGALPLAKHTCLGPGEGKGVTLARTTRVSSLETTALLAAERVPQEPGRLGLDVPG